MGTCWRYRTTRVMPSTRRMERTTATTEGNMKSLSLDLPCGLGGTWLTLYSSDWTGGGGGSSVDWSTVWFVDRDVSADSSVSTSVVISVDSATRA